MAKLYTYTDHKTGKILFQTVEPNFVSMDDIDRKALEHTGRDPRLDPFMNRQIRVVSDNQPVGKTKDGNSSTTVRRRKNKRR